MGLRVRSQFASKVVVCTEKRAADTRTVLCTCLYVSVFLLFSDEESMDKAAGREKLVHVRYY